MSEPMPQPPSTPEPRGPVGALRSPALQIFLAIITLGIWCLVWSYMTADELKRYRRQGLGGVVTLILAIFVFPVVWFTLANEVEMLYKEDGQSPGDQHDLGTLVPAPDHRLVRVVPAHAARAERVLGHALNPR